MDNRERIVRESLRLFSLKGFLSTSIQDVMKAGKLSYIIIFRVTSIPVNWEVKLLKNIWLWCRWVRMAIIVVPGI
jgi:hypothetical protein